MSTNKVEPQRAEVTPNRPQSSTCLCVINSNLVTETLWHFLEISTFSVPPPCWLLLFSCLFFISYLSVTFLRKEEGTPGPRPLPLLGNLLQIDLKRPYKTLYELSKTYGSVFTVYLGTNKVVVLAGYEAVREALVNYAEEFGEILCFVGILFANGESWKELRRFALTTLKDFGMVIEEHKGMIFFLCINFTGNAFDTALPINYATANIISSIVYGTRFDYGDPVFKRMVKRANQSICVTGSASVQVGSKHSVKKNRTEDIKNLTKHLKDTLEPGLCRGLVDCFLIRKQKEEVRQYENLTFTVSNLFAAGTDTTAATLRWGLLLMAKYPHIQGPRGAEPVVGSRQVCVDDRKNLPYTDAVIHETQRLANIVPMSLPHQTSQDVTFKGYFIKKSISPWFPTGNYCVSLLTSVLYDESEWESPRTFNPSHFLDKNGQFVKRDAFMPFSAGRRMCLGEGLAKMELFLFFTSLIQRFRFTPPPGITEDELDLTPAVGFTTLLHLICCVRFKGNDCSAVSDKLEI
uniref:Uncharacterized protein n=1 Tax=Oreochromis aureus TaxID=47969 RepID=A0AAZ1XQE9_OREAU